MTLDDDTCYRALAAHDHRFDGVFFVAVKSTGIYCRPVCTAKTPGRSRCRFFASAALAERAGFRPCLRCRPELAPGNAPIDSRRSIARTAAARINSGALQRGESLEQLAANLGLSSRQLRRVVQAELGVSPIELAQTNRLLLAKRLITETQLPMTQVAFAAGFESVRRFNSLFRSHYHLVPSELRRDRRATSPDHFTLTLAYRPPLAWRPMLRFIAARAAPGVECVLGETYHRTVSIGPHRGWLSVSPIAGRHELSVQLATSLAPVLPTVLARLQNLFDLDARPDIIAGHLRTDTLLAELVATNPGLRVQGAFDSTELAVRAILGQQVSVRAASTLAGRVAERFGEPIETPIPGLNRITPTAATLAAASSNDLATVGMPSVRAESVRTVARLIASGELDLEPGADPAATVAQLVELPGIGPWTAEYIAMRALRWPDAFPAADLGLAKALQLSSTKAVQAVAEAWRPWRAYAAMHLWQSLATSAEPITSKFKTATR